MKFFKKKMQADPLAEAEAEKKDWKRSKAFIGGMTALIVIIGVNFGSAAIGGFFGKEHARSLQTAMMKLDVKNSDWKTVTEIPGFSIETPVPLKKTYQEIPYDYQNILLESISYEYSSTPFTLGLAHTTLAEGLGGEYKIDVTANASIHNQIAAMKAASKIEDFVYNIETLNLPGVQRRITKASYKVDGLKSETLACILLCGDDLYICNIIFVSNDHNRKIAERIINSVKIRNK